MSRTDDKPVQGPPPGARLGASRSVILEVLVNREGSIEQIAVLHNGLTHPGMARNLIEGIVDYHYDPARLGDSTVPMILIIEDRIETWTRTETRTITIPPPY